MDNRGLSRKKKSFDSFLLSLKEKRPKIKIEDYLIDNNINYTFQKRFLGLVGKRKQPLRFDFHLPNYNLCIEYDGEGHFWKDFYLNKTGILDYSRDIQKDLYCNKNNIKLLRIPYWEKKNIIEYLDFYLSELLNFESIVTNNYRGKEYIHLIS